MPIGLGHVTRSTRLAQAFTVIRRAEVVNDFGEVSVTTTREPATGVIHPKASALARGEDSQTMSKSIEVHTTFRLRGPVPGFQPDLVLWHGNYYVVKSLDDFSDYGAGHLSAECASIDFIDQPAPGPNKGMDG